MSSRGRQSRPGTLFDHHPTHLVTPPCSLVAWRSISQGGWAAPDSDSLVPFMTSETLSVVVQERIVGRGDGFFPSPSGGSNLGSGTTTHLGESVQAFNHHSPTSRYFLLGFTTSTGHLFWLVDFSLVIFFRSHTKKTTSTFTST